MVSLESTIITFAAATIFLIVIYKYFSKRTFIYLCISLLILALSIIIHFTLGNPSVALLAFITICIFVSVIIYNIGLFKMLKELKIPLKNKKENKKR
jgi:uncharacterized membrane protein YoaK (UPF0700 family)